MIFDSPLEERLYLKVKEVYRGQPVTTERIQIEMQLFGIDRSDRQIRNYMTAMEQKSLLLRDKNRPRSGYRPMIYMREVKIALARLSNEEISQLYEYGRLSCADRKQFECYLHRWYMTFRELYRRVNRALKMAEFQRAVGMSKTTVYHLWKMLRGAGLIEARSKFDGYCPAALLPAADA